MDGFERRREQKKLAILEAALSLFIEYGTQKVSIAEIAEKANVSQVTIYNYFDSKDRLIQHVLEFYVDKIWNEQREMLDSNLPFEEKIKKIIFDKKEAANQIHDKFFQDFMKSYAAGAGYIEDLYKNEALPRFIQLFNEGKEQGCIDPSISNEAILFYLQMFKDYIQKEEFTHLLLPMTEELTKLFFYGIAGKK